MTTLEIVLIGVSISETVVTYYVIKRKQKKLDKEIYKARINREQYEKLIEALPIGKNLL